MSEAAQYQPGRFRRVFVEEPGHLKPVLQELGAGDAIGVDVEMVQRVERRPGGYQDWVQVLALIQLAADTLSVVVDPVRCRDLSPLRLLMAGPARKVFLGGGQDAALLEGAGIPARNVVDVGEVALAIFGRREDGMAALARRIFGLSLDKTVRRADWLARPLNPALLTYAHRDAELTLLIYRWFQEHYPEALAVHERLELDPGLPPSTPAWLREAYNRPPVEALGVVAEYGLDPARHGSAMAEELRAALALSQAPRQINRLLRLAGELSLASLVPEVVPYLSSPSSLVRGAAARAIGQLAEPEVGEPLLQPLKQDPIEDVRKTAEAALRELMAPRLPLPETEGEEEPSLDEEALSALQELMRRLEEK
jgi:hypothetical protein